LLAPNKIGTDGASVYSATILDAVNAGLIPPNPLHRVSKHLQQGIESDHFHVKKNMPKVGGRRLPVVSNRAKDDRRLRGDALADEGLRLRRGVDRSQTERTALVNVMKP